MHLAEDTIIEQNTIMEETSPRRDVFLFSHPRTASNLLCRLLSDQPNWIQAEYHFRNAFTFARKSFNWGPVTDIDEEQRATFANLLQEGYNELQRFRDATRLQDKFCFVKSHLLHIWEPSNLSQSIWGGESGPSFPPLPPCKAGSMTKRTNPTIFTDDFLSSWLPIFLIRHPALVFESWYRAESSAEPVDILDKSLAFFTTFTYIRQLYEWFETNACNEAGQTENDGQDQPCSRPVVIDADDIMEQRSINRLCEICSMDALAIRYTWERTTPAGGKLASRRRLSYMGGFWSSTSIDKSKSSRGLDLSEKRNQWKEEFGDGVADRLYDLVQNAMADYTYLRHRKI